MSIFDDIIIIIGDQFWKQFNSYAPAFIALIGTFATIYFNKKTSNENRNANEEIAKKQRLLQLGLNTKQQEFQNEIRNLNEKHLTDLKNKELVANIIAKQRIDWLQDVRTVTSEFISSYFNLISDFMAPTDIKKHADNLNKFNKHYYLLYLYYPLKDKKGNINKNHQVLLDSLENFYHVVKEVQLNHSINTTNKIKSGIDTEKLDYYLDKFIEESTLYFKLVWEDAKSMK